MTLARAGREIELKLLVPADAVRRLAAHRLLRGRTRPARRRLYSIYFDTPALDLWRQGIALRVRREGRRWVQTVKGGGSAQGGLHQRAEAEAEVAGPAPDVSRVRDRELAVAFASPRLRAQLAPVFTTEFTRSSRVLELDAEVRVEASVDQGEIRSGKRAEPLIELELELKGGAPHHLYDLALKLADDIPLSIEDRSKADRGYALARDERAAPVKARAAALDRGMSVNEAFKAVMWASLAHLQANERGMMEGRDPEFLHQMRVALRRLRSAVGVFAPPLPEPVIAPVSNELRWLAASLGPARDWDVFVTETLPPIEEEFGAHSGLSEFSARCNRLRRTAGARARRAVRSARYRRLALSTAAWLASEGWLPQLEQAAAAELQLPVGEFAAAVLERRYNQLRKKGRRLGELSAVELHRLRIAIKKFRYAADFFAGLYDPGAARQALKQLARLQDVLGAMNDAATAANLMAGGFDGARGRRALEAKGILLGWSRGRAATLRRELKGAWKEFRSAGKFWAIAPVIRYPSLVARHAS
jgi:inorganic triphosphatase YgiF